LEFRGAKGRASALRRHPFRSCLGHHRLRGCFCMPRKIDIRFTPFALRVRRSRIDRFGVFAEKSIPRARMVIEYTGERITRPQAVRRFRRIWRRTGPKRYYLACLNRRWIVDGAVGGSGAELVNHSCDPNLSIRKRGGRILFYSRRPIRKGEELTLDYRYSPKAPPAPCRCGSTKCRGTINRK
jgi:SET domain-containing protein